MFTSKSNPFLFYITLWIFFLSYIHRIMYLLQHLVMFVCWKDRGIWDKGPCFRCVNSGNTDGCKDESNNGLGKSISMVVYKGSTFTNGSCRIIRLFRYLKRIFRNDNWLICNTFKPSRSDKYVLSCGKHLAISSGYECDRFAWVKCNIQTEWWMKKES